MRFHKVSAAFWQASGQLEYLYGSGCCCTLQAAACIWKQSLLRCSFRRSRALITFAPNFLSPLAGGAALPLLCCLGWLVIAAVLSKARCSRLASGLLAVRPSARPATESKPCRVADSPP